MNIPQLGTLCEVDLREVWKHEALSFTPWLAENLTLLSDLIGIPLQVEGVEVAVDQYFADILARDPVTDRLVLIENQLEPSDHSHLGQILTYLSGLEVKVVIWIARDFREPHLSAIRWLNDETDESFAFFAIKVRAVRIGDSHPAPQFEIICRPNYWEKHLNAVKKSEISEQGQLRTEFWQHHLDRHPEEVPFGPANGANSRWHTLDDIDLVVSSYIASSEIGVFARGKRNADPGDVHALLSTHADSLSQQLNCELRPHSEGRFLINRLRGDLNNRQDWDRLSDWLSTTAEQYKQTLLATFRESPPP